MLDHAVFSSSIKPLQNDQQRALALRKKLLLQIAHLLAEFFNRLERLMFLVIPFVVGFDLAESNVLARCDAKPGNEALSRHCFSIAAVYSPRRAARAAWARWSNALCAAGTLASSPCQIDIAGSWIARANE